MGAGTTELRGLRVAELAEATGLTPDTVRYYERVGLLPPPARTPAGYRMFGVEIVDRVRFIQGCQRLGLRLRDIADLLAVRDTGACPCEPAEQLLSRRLTELDAEIARLVALRVQMATMVDSLPSPNCPPPAPGASWCPPGEGGGDQR
ncbi:MAG: heavy metal-responsive transcriptional regulator [Micromonosporaceae bacterium]